MKTKVRNTNRIAAAVLAVLMLVVSAPLSELFGLSFGTQAAAADDSKYLVYYADVINNYKTVIDKNFYRGSSFPENDKFPQYVNWFLVDYWCNYSKSYNALYYVLHDINNDEFPELLIGAEADYDSNGWEMYGVYTYTDKVRAVASSEDWGFQVKGHVFENGVICETISSTWKNTAWVFYKLNKNGKTKKIDMIMDDTENGTKYFRDWDEKTELSKRQAEQLCKKYTGQKPAYDLESDLQIHWKKINDLPKITGLKKPTGLKVAASNTMALKLKWNKVKGAKGYEVYRYNPSTKKYVKLAATGKASVKLTDLKPGTTYQFAVRAYSKPTQKVLFSKCSKLLKASTTS